MVRVYLEKTLKAMYWRARSFDAVKFPQRKRSEWQDWNYRTEIFAFSHRLQENLNEDTLRCILTHKSFVDDFNRKQESLTLPSANIQPNDNLVQRGAQLLDDCIKPYIRHNFSRLPENGVTAITDYLKSTPVMADVAKWIGCKDIVLTAEYPPAEFTMAKTVYALVGGIERDLGIDKTRRFIADIIISYLEDKNLLDDVWSLPNPKETLNVILSNSGLEPYEPRIIFQAGKGTLEACHIIGVYTSRTFLGSSPGETLEIAEECACLDALQRLFDLKEHRAPLKYGQKSEQIDYSAHNKEHDYIDTWKFKLD